MSDSVEMAPVPVPDLDTAGYWAAAREGELRLQWCSDCSRFQHFPAPRCGSCLGTDLSWRAVSGQGFVYSFTVVHHGVVPGFATPYVVAWVELVEQVGLRVLTNITEISPGEARIGMAVECFFEERGQVVVPQFRAANGGR